jgi:TonB family protein
MRYPILIVAIAFMLLVSPAFAENEIVLPRSSEGIRKEFAIYAPKPKYSLEARRRKLVGYGIGVLEIDKRTGYVRSARMDPSTGHKMLDDAALAAFKQWRFKLPTASKVKIPVRYSMKGVN